MYLDLGRICMVLEWTLGLPTPGSIFSAAVSVWEHGRLGTTRHFVFVFVSFTLIYRAASPLLVKHSTINLSLTSEESLTDSKLPDTGYLDRSQCMKLVLVSFTLFYSATCALILSVNVCVGYMCFVKP